MKENRPLLLAPSIIDDKFNDWFDGDADYYMNKVAYVKNLKRSIIESAIHSDGSARVQLVSSDNQGLYAILDEFYKITGIPIVINTSLNLKGRPIARSFVEVFDNFERLKPEVLVLDNFLVTRND